ncbi:DinB family protein [Jiulongibacter sediminis]|uniref:DinB family protein n=1 Tax=Jiulongibacter sediminis TaxID=1605367 RepID=UPI0026EBFE2E|nr:DinB family protein [Jiulongibacter sediminis]
MIKRPTSDQEIGLIYKPYLDLTPDGDYLKVLDQNTVEIVDFFRSIPLSKHDFAYAEGKWTIKEVLQHLSDVEYIMAFRAYVAARTEGETHLPGMDEELFMSNSGAGSKTFENLLSEFLDTRKVTRTIFENLTEKSSQKTVLIYDKPVSARTFAYMIPGHALHHIQVVMERYLGLYSNS